MKYEVYCDESNPDVFSSRSNNKAKFLMIGSLWLSAEIRGDIKKELNRLKAEHSFDAEIKWHKVHSKHEAFYKALTETFMSKGQQLRFRAIAVEADKVDLTRFHDSDHELGFYKFYYQMLKHWILDFNDYAIFCDEKTNRVGDRLPTLRRVLSNANISSTIASVQALPSHEVLLLQFCDYLLGIASCRMNGSVAKGTVKDRLCCHLEELLDRPVGPTPRAEQKFNIFKINLQGGW